MCVDLSLLLLLLLLSLFFPFCKFVCVSACVSFGLLNRAIEVFSSYAVDNFFIRGNKVDIAFKKACFSFRSVNTCHVHSQMLFGKI